ncbi:DUF1150 family protein [Chelatococcus sp. GCM10030263]|uniref:BQ00720 family protein n=1 Tax=Chelatococcus sp. GCM10030263 TaxID=3273387 RepID=UPI0036088E68
MNNSDAFEFIGDVSDVQAFALAGEGKVAYVRPIRSEDVNRLFPQVPEIQPGLELFALLGADGTPILLTDSKDAAIANAWENNLEPVSVH